jgi:predicted transcriptional regulator
MSYSAPSKTSLKTDILFSLLERDKKLSEFRKEMPSRGTTILHVLKELERTELTTKKDGLYKLTPLGIFEANLNRGCCRAFGTLRKHREFWLTHDVSVIPPSLIMNIGALENSTLIKATHLDLQKVHESFVQLLRNTKVVHGISPIFHQDYIDALKVILKQPESKGRLIVTNTVFDKFKQVNDAQLNEYCSEGRLQIFLNDNLKIALTITEISWSIGLFTLAGDYDYANDLIGTGEEGREWVYQLFNSILEQSTTM